MLLQPVLLITKARTFLFLIFFALPCQLSFAQSNKVIDSLKNGLNTAAEDTNKVNNLNDLSWQLATSQYAESKSYAVQALALAEKLDFRKGMAASYNTLGRIYNAQRNYSEALKNCLVGLKIREEIGDKKGIASSYHTIGRIYHAQSNYPETLKKYLAGLKIQEEIGDKKGIASSYNDIGIIYINLGYYPEALKNLLAALEIEEEIKGVNIASNLINIGVAYMGLSNYPEALKSFQSALKKFEESGANVGASFAYGDIGEVYEVQGNYTEALKNYQLSLKTYEKTGRKASPVFYHNLAGVNIKLNKFNEAKKYLDSAFALFQGLQSKRDSYYILAKLDSAMGNYQQALVHYKLYTDYKDSLYNETKSKQIAQMKEQYETEKKDKEILLLTGDKEKLEAEKQISALLLKTKNDSLVIAQAENDNIELENDKVKLEYERAQTLNLYNEQQLELLGNEKKFQQLQIEKNNADYAVQKAEVESKQGQLLILGKEKDIQALQLNKQKQAKNYLIAGIALVAILLFFLYRNYRTRQQLKLQTLRNKIASDLHDDVGSTLSSISIFSQIAQQQSKETIPMLDSIGESSRKMLDAMADIVWTINPENDQFEKIISRMKNFAYELLGARNIDFEFAADENVSNMKLPMEVRKNLYLIFKEATNNMVKYAQANKAMFAIHGGKNELTMMIRDNGRGFDINRSTEGNGLKNMKKRATEVGGQLTIDSQPGNGTTIQLRVAV